MMPRLYRGRVGRPLSWESRPLSTCTTLILNWIDIISSFQYTWYSSRSYFGSNWFSCPDQGGATCTDVGAPALWRKIAADQGVHVENRMACKSNAKPFEVGACWREGRCKLDAAICSDWFLKQSLKGAFGFEFSSTRCHQQPKPKLLSN